MLSLGTWEFQISTKTTSFCLKFAKSLIRDRAYPQFMDATLVSIIRGFGVPSALYARALNSSSFVFVLTYQILHGFCSISWNQLLSLKFIQLVCDLATSNVSLLMCSRQITIGSITVYTYWLCSIQFCIMKFCQSNFYCYSLFSGQTCPCALTVGLITCMLSSCVSI